jgi:hypothetical protein
MVQVSELRAIRNGQRLLVQGNELSDRSHATATLLEHYDPFLSRGDVNIAWRGRVVMHASRQITVGKPVLSLPLGEGIHSKDAVKWLKQWPKVFESFSSPTWQTWTVLSATVTLDSDTDWVEKDALALFLLVEKLMVTSIICVPLNSI